MKLKLGLSAPFVQASTGRILIVKIQNMAVELQYLVLKQSSFLLSRIGGQSLGIRVPDWQAAELQLRKDCR